jgi:hypothetical protein
MIYVLILTIAFGIGRFLMPASGQIHPDDLFKDACHLFVGGLFGAAILATVVRDSYTMLSTSVCRNLWILAIGLTVLEVIAFLIFKN